MKKVNTTPATNSIGAAIMIGRATSLLVALSAGMMNA